MILVQFYRNKNGEIKRFKISNHGEPIVCAGVSALVISCVNFITSRLNVKVHQNYQDSEFIDFKILDTSDNSALMQANLIIEQMAFGICQIHDNYPNEICISNMEV